MRLRALVLGLALSSLAAPAAIDAQRPEKLYRIGVLERTSTGINAANLDGFRQGLRDLGYVDGKNFVIEYRSATAMAAFAAKSATNSIPMVFTDASDPVSAGLAASLARPGGNLTGLTNTAPDLSAKRLEVLKEIVPTVTRVAVLWNASNPAIARQVPETE
jgi:ABC-type uncharacterized transport system substrate-binding protein